MFLLELIFILGNMKKESIDQATACTEGITERDSMLTN